MPNPSKQNIQLLETGGHNSILIAFHSYDTDANHWIFLIGISFFAIRRPWGRYVGNRELLGHTVPWDAYTTPERPGDVDTYQLELIKWPLCEKHKGNQYVIDCLFAYKQWIPDFPQWIME